MIGIRKIAVFLLIFLAMASVAIAATPPLSPPDYFPLRTGYWWKYQANNSLGNQSKFTIQVLAEQQQRGATLYQVETRSSTTPILNWYSKLSGWVLATRQTYPATNQQVDFQPAKKFLKNPMIQGDVWQWEGKGMLGIALKESSQVAGIEEIEVPAGTFQAMKIVTQAMQGGTTIKRTYWSANQIGLIKDTIEIGLFQSTSELTDYSFKQR